MSVQSKSIFNNTVNCKKKKYNTIIIYEELGSGEQFHITDSLEHNTGFQDTHTEKAHSNKTSALNSSDNCVICTLNQSTIY